MRDASNTTFQHHHTTSADVACAGSAITLAMQHMVESGIPEDVAALGTLYAAIDAVTGREDGCGLSDQARAQLVAIRLRHNREVRH